MRKKKGKKIWAKIQFMREWLWLDFIQFLKDYKVDRVRGENFVKIIQGEIWRIFLLNFVKTFVENWVEILSKIPVNVDYGKIYLYMENLEQRVKRY